MSRILAVRRPKGTMAEMVRAYDPFQAYQSTKTHWTVNRYETGLFPASTVEGVIVAMSSYCDTL